MLDSETNGGNTTTLGSSTLNNTGKTTLIGTGKPDHFKTTPEIGKEMSNLGPPSSDVTPPSSDRGSTQHNQSDKDSSRRRKENRLTAERYMEKKRKDYMIRGRVFGFLYYTVRLLGGTCAGVLPFFVADSGQSGKALLASAGIVGCTILDFIFNPKENWRLYSTASDDLEVAIIRNNDPDGYETNKAIFQTLKETKNGRMALLAELDTVLNKNKRADQPSNP